MQEESSLRTKYRQSYYWAMWPKRLRGCGLNIVMRGGQDRQPEQKRI